MFIKNIPRCRNTSITETSIVNIIMVCSKEVKKNNLEPQFMWGFDNLQYRHLAQKHMCKSTQFKPGSTPME